jgi:AcrR family transcriptional regulator
MAQVLKAAVRARIRRAALEEFVAVGAARATMAAIAARAGVGVASLYSYYDRKEALFLDVVSRAFARDFERRLERRVHALAFLAVGETAPEEAARASSDEILAFWLEHRLEVVVLLDRAEGTPHAGYARRFVRLLQRLTLVTLRASHPHVRLSAPELLVLETIFENTRRMLAILLERHATAAGLRAALQAFWAYQLPGLRGFAGWALRDRRRADS